MTRGKSLIALLGALALGACGSAEIVVTAQIEQPSEEGTTSQPLGNLEVQILPYDRDVLFDSLEAAFPEPDPGIPDSVLTAQDEVRAAQEEWRQAEARWQEGRDRLQEINAELETLNRGESRYAILFREFGDVEAEVNQMERVMESAFQRFTDLQQASISAAEQACVIQNNWADEAFAGVGEAVAMRLAATGRNILVDTTDAQGILQIEVPPGTWWIHSRYELPYSELYWNERVEVQKGDPVQIRLDNSNAEERLNIC